MSPPPISNFAAGCRPTFSYPGCTRSKSRSWWWSATENGGVRRHLGLAGQASDLSAPHPVANSMPVPAKANPERVDIPKGRAAAARVRPLSGLHGEWARSRHGRPGRPAGSEDLNTSQRSLDEHGKKIRLDGKPVEEKPAAPPSPWGASGRICARHRDRRPRRCCRHRD